MGKYVLILVAVVLMIPQLCLAGDGHVGCKVCGMYTDVYQHTATQLTYKDGHMEATCGVACMMRLINDAGGPDAFATITVRGWATRQTISAGEAVYVIGSDLVPDMMPNLIAFSTRQEAEKFKEEHGGELLSFTQALMSISPMAMTMPVTVQSAALPAKGATGSGVGYMYMKMDEVRKGTESIDPLTFVGQPGQMMGPKEMTTSGEMVMVSYGITDDLAMSAKIIDLHKTMEKYTSGGANTATTKNNGISDLDLTFRYNLWKDSYYSKFFTLLAGTTLPTGQFDADLLSSPGLQLGTGDFTGTAGIVYSQRLADFWFHSTLTYTYKLENSDEFQFGNETRFGAAFHYTPTYDLMMGVELNGVHYGNNELKSVDVVNSGGFRSYITGVANWKFLTALGGNFSVRLAAAVPLYEDLDAGVSMGKESVQMGGGYSFNGMLSFNRRFAQL